MKIALILFAYNRPKYLRRAIKTHVVPPMDTYAFIDKSDKQKEIIEIIHNSGLYNVIIPRQEHYGLNRNIKEGIDWVLQDHDAVIVLEDDLLLSDDAIMWLKEGLSYHHKGVVSLQKDSKKYNFRCWGWGMVKVIWDQIIWEGNESWDVIVDRYFKRSGWRSYCSPKQRVKHIGAWGVHYNLIGYLKEKL